MLTRQPMRSEPPTHQYRSVGYSVSRLIGALFLALAAGTTVAQPVYRIVGPDGKVTFSDRPPSATESVQANPVPQPGGGTRATATEPSPDASLPATLRTVVRKYPVTLYTASSCAPCDSGRTLLRQRGVPFTEKTVNTNADIAAFQKLAPNSSGFPLLMVGAQPVQGFMGSEWNSYLDAAGYPKTSALPAGYQGAAAQPLAPPKPVDPSAPAAAAASAAEADAAQNAAAQQRRPRPATKPANENPAGIKF